MSTAVVVGGGIGGLAAAIGLRRRGWDVMVLERAAEFAPVGAGLTLMPNGLGALDALGVGAQVRAALTPYEAAVFRSKDGRPLARVAPVGGPGAGVHRATLHDLLVSALPHASVQTGCTVLGVEGGERPTVRYEQDGGSRAIETDLLVGADGIGSTVRAALWPEVAPPVEVGAVAWRGVTRRRGILRDAEVSWSQGTEVGLVPLEDSRVYWYVCVTSNRAGQPGEDHPLADALAAADGWYADAVAAITGTDGDGVIRTELRHLVPGPAQYARRKVALLGDAAHAMPPYVGQGANQALEDAAVLASLVEPRGDVAGALREYDRRRRPRARRVARAARLAGRGGHQVQSAAVVALRDAALRAVPSGVLGRSLGRLTTWRAPRVPLG